MALSNSIENETSSYVENGIPSYLFTSNSFKNYVNKLEVDKVLLYSPLIVKKKVK